MKIGSFEINLASGKRVYLATLIFVLLYVAMVTPSVDPTIRGGVMTLAASVGTYYYATHKEPTTVPEK